MPHMVVSCLSHWLLNLTFTPLTYTVFHLSVFSAFVVPLSSSRLLFPLLFAFHVTSSLLLLFFSLICFLRSVNSLFLFSALLCLPLPSFSFVYFCFPFSNFTFLSTPLTVQLFFPFFYIKTSPLHPTAPPLPPFLFLSSSHSVSFLVSQCTE